MLQTKTIVYLQEVLKALNGTWAVDVCSSFTATMGLLPASLISLWVHHSTAEFILRWIYTYRDMIYLLKAVQDFLFVKKKKKRLNNE